MTKFVPDCSFLGGRLKAYRKRKGLTLKDLATFTGIAQPTLSEVENGHYDLSGQKLASLVKNTDIDSRWLLTGEGEMFAGAPAAEAGSGDTCCMPEASGLPPESRELVAMAIEVLGSGTKYARLLTEQIRSLHESIRFTKEIETLKADLAETMEHLAETRELTINVVERLAAIEIAERERIKEKGRVEEGEPAAASSPEESQKTAG